MNITFWLNGVKRQAEVRPDELLLDFLRKNYIITEAPNRLRISGSA